MRPRRQRRIDAVILAGSLIFVLEFKSGPVGESLAAARQVEDYALDLAYFHKPSHNRIISPVLIAPDVKTTATLSEPHADTPKVRPVARATPDQLAEFLFKAVGIESVSGDDQIAVREWDEGVYEPVPTVIDAAMALYAGMSVREIGRSHADTHNLTQTTDFIFKLIAEAQSKKEKVICFITGVPGAGKTLAGLNFVHSPEIHGGGRPASVFMSGNGPLVEILREALALDCAARTEKTKREARSEVKTFIQNIHHFVADNLDRPDNQCPYEHAIVFDEAQRAWNAERNLKKYRKRSPAWHVSEPEMVLKIMDRHPDWAAIVALVGGGQEIHDGEAGLPEWGRTLQSRFPHWRVFASFEATDGGESVAGASLFGSNQPVVDVIRERTLHLDTCIRSHHAPHLTTWVNRVLTGDHVSAALIRRQFNQFPILLTRDLNRAKTWLANNTRGNRRCGLVASSGAVRLRAYGIETSMAIREAYSYPHWFLFPRGDVRASFQLEVVATEFEIQGLELDIVGLCWGGDFTWDKASYTWRQSEFKGDRWKKVSNPIRATLVLNKYRVLLTRAREGLLIWVPLGSAVDLTQDISAMNDTAQFLIDCGVTPID